MDIRYEHSTNLYWRSSLGDYGVRIIGGKVAEWQIDSIKEYASRLKRRI